MLGAGLVMLKAGELSFVTAALARRWVRDQSAIVGRVLARSGVLTYRDDVTGERDLPVPDRYRWAIEWAELRRGSRVLDVGCFTGELLALAADEVGSASCTGIDIPGPWLEDASSRHPELSFLPVEKLESAAMTEVGRFDTVFLLETIEHLPRGTEAAVLANIARALAPGGHLLCSAPASGALALGDPAWLLTGHRHYRAGRLAKLAAAAGLEVVEVAYSGNIWALIDMNLFYVQKHILRRPYRPSRFVHERADTGLYSRRRITRLNVWVKLRV